MSSDSSRCAGSAIIHHNRARTEQVVERAVDRFLRRGGRSPAAITGDHGDAQTGQSDLALGAQSDRHAPGVNPVRAGDHPQRCGRVGHPPRERADLCAPVAPIAHPREVAGGGHQTGGGPDAAPRGRQPDAAA